MPSISALTFRQREQPVPFSRDRSFGDHEFSTDSFLDLNDDFDSVFNQFAFVPCWPSKIDYRLLRLFARVLRQVRGAMERSIDKAFGVVYKVYLLVSRIDKDHELSNGCVEFHRLDLLSDSLNSFVVNLI